MDYIKYAIPIFFLLIGLEVWVDKAKQSRLYRFSDAVTNISCGITQQITGALIKTALIIGYIHIYENHRLLDIADSVWTYVLLFIGIDFCYYWFHRSAHEVSLFWGTHIVHHQSEDYNLTVALRQSALQALVSTSFYFPLALLGFNPIAFVTLSSFQTLYQFWIHTRTIDRLHPVLEYVLNTPSHHRVHHGRNPKYIDKNHGGTLIIWDRMFGTFQREEEEVIYGVTKPLQSWNPLWAQIDYYADLKQEWQQLTGWKERAALLFLKPGWRPARLGGTPAIEEPRWEHRISYDVQVDRQQSLYILWQYVVMLAVASWFLFSIDGLSAVAQMCFAIWVLLRLLSIGGVMESKDWTRWMEPLGWLTLPLLWALVVPSGTWLWAGIGAGLLLAGLSWLHFVGFRPKKIKNVND